MTVAEGAPVPVGYVNVGDCYAESGDAAGLLEKYGLSPAAIVEAVKRVKKT